MFFLFWYLTKTLASTEFGWESVSARNMAVFTAFAKSARVGGVGSASQEYLPLAVFCYASEIHYCG
jgi:hypothetical protein